jgi:hypothetical protein
VTWLAILAIALHAVLWGPASAVAAATATDPFLVICHSAPAGEAQTNPDLAPSQCCDHCNVCGAVAVPAMDVVLAGQLLPAPLLHVLRPLSSAAHTSLATTPKLARGPPAFA